MSKELVIKSSNCVIERGAYVRINGEEIGDLIKNNLPNIEEYKDYKAEVRIQIKILEEKPLEIQKIGYGAKAPVINEIGEVEEESDNAI